MNNIDLSVIVACYNIEGYLKPCLDSLSKTAFPKSNLEILMVDDGSTDNTGKIIDEYASKYSYFKAIHEKNRGLSGARNTGMDHASGKYVAFVDGDDIVPPNAYSDMMYIAEVKKSDMVAGFVHRFDNLRNKDSYLHSFAIKDNLYNVSLDQDHDLLYDTTAWNKVYRLAFLKANHIRFIPRILYEDLPFTLKVRVKSNRLSTIKNVVYCWRWRPNSITQSRDTFSNFLSRIHSLNLCRKILFKAGYTYKSSLFKDFERKILLIDLNVFLHNIGDSEEDYIYKVQEVTYRFLRDWHLLHSPIFKTLHVKAQILYYAIETGNLELLKKFTYTNPRKIGQFNVSPITKHYDFEIPEIKNDAFKHINMHNNAFQVSQTLNCVQVNPDTHVISGNGMFKIHNLPLYKKHFSNNNYHDRIAAKLVNLTNDRSMPIHFVRRRTPLYKRTFRPKTSWTNSRYDFDFNYDKCIRTLGNGTWKIKMFEYVDNKYWVTAYMGKLHDINDKDKFLFNPLASQHHFITDSFNTNWELTFKVAPLTIVGSVNSNWISNPKVVDYQLIFSAGLNNPKAVTPIIQSIDSKIKMKGRVKANGSDYQLIFQINHWNYWDRNLFMSLKLIHSKTNHVVNYQFLYNHSLQSINIGQGHQVAISYNSRNYIKISLNYQPLLITKCSLENNRFLNVFAKFPDFINYKEVNLKRIKIEFLSRNLENRYILTPKKNQIHLNKNGISFQILLLNPKRTQLLLLAGRYNATVYLPLDQHIVMLKLELIPKLVMPHFQKISIRTSDIVKYRICNDKNGQFIIKISQPQFGFNRKKSHRAIAYSVLYPLMRLLPIRNVMVFDSYWASQFSSNERAMYEYMQKNHPNIKTVWFFHNRLTPITYHGKRVKVNTLQYWYYMATARYLIQNTNLPNQYFKRNGQIEVETLHGTFLKHMGFDQPQFKDASQSVQDRFARRIRRWDYMVVPSEYMRRIASHAFDYHQKILPFGFPRNDNLVNNDNKSYIKSVKIKLGIPLDKKVILYAPTFRENNPFNFELNLKEMKAKLSDKYVLLIRLHYFVAHTHSFYQYPGFVYDVSDYLNINDLFLISDVLVTDYSSVMFDYSYLRRPIIYYAYDKDYYVNNNNRGVYLNYNKEMPGPIVKTQLELIKAIINLDQIKNKYYKAINDFSDRFAEYGRNGDATKHVVETILNTKVSDLDQKPDRHVVFNKFWHWFRINDLSSNLLNYFGKILPKRNIIIFDSYFGTKYSDNPKALYLYIKKHYPKYKLYWSVDSKSVPYFKKHHIPFIKRFGYRGLLKQAEAKFWITNSYLPSQWKIPDQTIVLQTWHGTPLKLIGHDIDQITMPSTNVQKYHRNVYKDNRRWDYLLAPNMYSERIMTRAFRKDANQMMLAEYPRNDILVNASADKINEIKRRLGIPSNKKVILYAPTWRDNEFIKYNKFVDKLHLDLSKLKNHYGHKIIVLIRSHYMISNRLDLSNYRNFAIDVSDYQDISELYLISDVLITDYSSAMFDYAILKRPMIFFDYDYSEYTNNIRGLYFNFKRVAPGPVVSTTNSLIHELDNILDGNWRMNDNYKLFIRHFDKWMDGHSSARVIRQLFRGNNVHPHFFDKDELKLPNTVNLKDGTSMWMPDKDFTNRFDVNFYQNYDRDNQQFKVIKGMQLESEAFNKLIGMKYVLINNPKLNYNVWVNKDDIIK